MKKLIIFVLVTFFLSFVNVHAEYSVNCLIEPLPLKEEVLMTTDAFYLDITIINKGNETIPPSKYKVDILNPNKQLEDDYFSFTFPLNEIDIASNLTYRKKWEGRNSSDAVFEMTVPGTWTIIVEPLDIPKNQILMDSDRVQYKGKCKRSFSVWDKNQYFLYKATKELAESQKDLFNINKNLTEETIASNKTSEKLNITILFLALVAFLVSFMKLDLEKLKTNSIRIFFFGTIIEIILFYSSYGIMAIIFFPILVFAAFTYLQHEDIRKDIKKEVKLGKMTIFLYILSIAFFLILYALFAFFLWLLFTNPTIATISQYIAILLMILLHVIVSLNFFVGIRELYYQKDTLNKNS
ncbi:MAG: hypothetical protein JW716_04205 [Candidatus Aenigmarchaeota archaeon]|nr:hypothetical protein [Candidatus Aenigmarchaeota archaeon]